ncbi:ferritin family protein [Chloroflexota bacterium]
MVIEQDKTLEALKIAIQMEIDGRAFYLKASQKSSNEMGKRLFQSLADEENLHRQKFEEIYNEIREKKTWPAIILQAGGNKGVRTILSDADGKPGAGTKVVATELEAVEKAMKMENKTYDFYKGRKEKAGYDAERDFYEALAIQEREHHTALLDYYEYLKDPASWFVTKEHPSLDGG